MRCFILIFALFTISKTVYAEKRDASLFEIWRAQHINEVAVFELFLNAKKLNHIVPLHQLLRTASNWEQCNAEPFEVSPPEHWQAVSRTLNLVAELKKQGILNTFEIHSAYRNSQLNECAKGKPASAHVIDFAMDLTSTSQTDVAESLCHFWQIHGKAWRMGLGRYESGRIHIDTKRFRTWGNDGDVPYCQKLP